MRINAFQPAPLVNRGELPGSGSSPLAPTASPPAHSPAPAAREEFSQVLGSELQRVNDLLAAADTQAQRVATGDADNLHDAMLAMAEADLALQVTMRVTQKAITAYQEISRMQI